MLHINIDMPRPWQTLAFAAALVCGLVYLLSPGHQRVVANVEPVIREETVQYDAREMLARQESILRAQLDILRDEAALGGDSATDAAIADATTRLRALLDDKQAMEAQIFASLRQQAGAQARAATESRRFYHANSTGDAPFALWPVEPLKGISAGFKDASYAARFGVPHRGIDIPTPQGTSLHAVDDGVITDAIDSGYGFSSITLRTATGISVLYGHVSAILVEEGQRVAAGDVIGKSGGIPGTRGAGLLTTGAHVHLETIVDGEHHDPLEFLPAMGDQSTDQGGSPEDIVGKQFWRNGKPV